MTTQETPPVLPTQQSTSGLAVTSMILGILSVLGGALLLLPPILAVIFGHVSLSKINKDPSVGGRGMGIAGLVMGYLCIVPVVLFGVMAAMAVPAFNEVRAVSQEKAIINNARQLASAAEQFYLEEGVTTVTLDALYESQYLFEIMPVADETYPTVFNQGEEVIITRESGESVTYDPSVY